MDKITVVVLLFSSLVFLAPASVGESVGAQDSTPSSSYMYIYCKRFPGNSYCANRFTREGQVKSIIRYEGKKDDGLSALAENNEYGVDKLPSYGDSSRKASSAARPMSTLSNEVREHGVSGAKVAINSKSYLIKWIEDIYGVKLSGDGYSAAELAEIYTRLMWCNTIRKELGEECDYMGSSSDDLRARYESAKKL